MTEHRVAIERWQTGHPSARRNIVDDHGAESDLAPVAENEAIGDDRTGPDPRPIANFHPPVHRCVVTDEHMMAEDALMRHERAVADLTALADHGWSAQRALGHDGSCVHVRVIADLYTARMAQFEAVARPRGHLERLAADDRPGVDAHVGTDHGAGVQNDTWADRCSRSDLHADGVDDGAGMHHGGGMNLRWPPFAVERGRRAQARRGVRRTSASAIITDRQPDREGDRGGEGLGGDDRSGSARERRVEVAG